VTRDRPGRDAERLRAAFAAGAQGPFGVPRLQLSAWRDALSLAASVPEVIEVVRRIVSARREHSPSLPTCWQPRDIRTREDIEHWARRIRSRPPGRPGIHALVALGDLMRLALERMNELGPRRADD
jgi:hypothetical protein